MTEFDALRREIEVRLQRETQYKLAMCTARDIDTQLFLEKEIKKNDDVIACIGDFLLNSHGSLWEKHYQNRFPRS